MAVRTQVGTMPCLCCAQEIPVKQSEGGALAVGCPWCDLSAYAKEGTQAFALISAKIKRPAPSSAPAPKPGADPAPKKKNEKVWL